MAIECALNIPATSLNAEDTQQLLRDNPRFGEKIDLGNVKYEQGLEYVVGGDNEKTRQYNALNVFEAGTPGALSLQEVENSISLGLWKIALGDKVVHLEVSRVPLPASLH